MPPTRTSPQPLARPFLLLLGCAATLACNSENNKTAPRSASAAASGAASSAVASAAAAPGYRLEITDEVHETPSGRLPNKLFADGPAAVFLSDTPFPDGPRKYASVNVFPKGTDPATICESDFPGPKKPNEYILSLSFQYDDKLKVGPAFSESSPGLAYLSKSNDGNITAAAVGKPKLVDIEITAVTADSITVVAKHRPGAPFKLAASLTAKICKSE